MDKTKNKKPSVVKTSDTIIRNNLERWFNSATKEEIVKGLAWYNEATQEADDIAKEFGISRYEAATVISCLSPNNKWRRNVRDAWAVVATWYAGKGEEDVKVCTFGLNKTKAFNALKGQFIAESAPKTHAFASTIAQIGDAVTVDMWHVRACLTRRDKSQSVVESINAKQYRRIDRITSELAKKHKIKPFQYQAIVWVSIKNNWAL